MVLPPSDQAEQGYERQKAEEKVQSKEQTTAENRQTEKQQSIRALISRTFDCFFCPSTRRLPLALTRPDKTRRRRPGRAVRNNSAINKHTTMPQKDQRTRKGVLNISYSQPPWTLSANSKGYTDAQPNIHTHCTSPNSS